MAVVEATPPAASETRRCLQACQIQIRGFSLVPAAQTQTTRIRYLSLRPPASAAQPASSRYTFNIMAELARRKYKH